MASSTTTPCGEVITAESPWDVGWLLSEHMSSCSKCKGGQAMSPRTRLRIARLLDRLPGQCWTDLVWWYTSPDRPVRKAWSPINGACRADARAAGRCYCNKIAAGERRRPWPLWVQLTLVVVLGVVAATLFASAALLLAAAPVLAPLPALREVEYQRLPDPEIARHECGQCINSAVLEVTGDPHRSVTVEAGGLACAHCAPGVIQHAVDQLRPDGVVRVRLCAVDVCRACWRPGGGHWPDCPAGGGR